MKVLHVFDHSLPHHSGYSFRSESIIRSQRELGITTVHLTSAKHEHAGGVAEQIGDLEFRRTARVVTGNGPLDQLRCVAALRGALRKVLSEERPDLIHAHSPSLNGLATLGLGVPVAYEVRACWEDAAVASGTTTEGSVRYRTSRALETFVARSVDQLIVICEGLREEFIRRGVPAARVATVGNAVDPDTLPRVDPAAVAEFRRDLGLEGRRVLGFFGSFYRYEGLELLVEALPSVLEHAPDVCLVLAGGGEAEGEIRDAVARLDLQAHVKMLGRVPHEDIGKCYGMADIMVFPRLPMKLTDMVTPLKPLEAMLLDSVVVASDVGGLRELVRHRETGMLFEAGNGQALAATLVEVLANPALAKRLRAGGHDYVLSERLWRHMAERYRVLYGHILRRRSLPPAAASGR